MSNTPKTAPPPLVVFDFDGTITTRDTFALFLRYYAGNLRWAGKIVALLPTFAAYKVGVIDRHAVKYAVIRTFFAREPMAKIDAKAEQFATDVIPDLVRPAAQACFDGKKVDIESLYICSASIAPYLRHWAKAQGLPLGHVLAVELEAENGICSGSVHGYNVWGANKVRRINDEFTPHSVVIGEAYGDSRGDRELLHAAKASFFRPFRV